MKKVLFYILIIANFCILSSCNTVYKTMDVLYDAYENSPHWENCSACNGSGLCKFCKGLKPDDTNENKCSVCHGSGSCIACNGSGGYHK